MSANSAKSISGARGHRFESCQAYRKLAYFHLCRQFSRGELAHCLLIGRQSVRFARLLQPFFASQPRQELLRQLQR